MEIPNINAEDALKYVKFAKTIKSVADDLPIDFSFCEDKVPDVAKNFINFIDNLDVDKKPTESKEDIVKKHENFAVIADDTQYDSPKVDTGDYKRIDTIENHDNGFAACIYENKNTNEIVVSYRCTNNGGGIDDDRKLAHSQIPDQYEDALKVYDEIKEKYPDANVQIVGYSLGASLAELVASEREDANAVTFEAYGTKNIIDNNDRFKDNHNCINYTTENSLVSGVTLHPGETKTIKHDGGGAGNVYDNVANRHYIQNFEDLHNVEYLDENEQDVMRGIKQEGVNLVMGNIDKVPGAEDALVNYFLG